MRKWTRRARDQWTKTKRNTMVNEPGGWNTSGKRMSGMSRWKADEWLVSRGGLTDKMVVRQS